MDLTKVEQIIALSGCVKEIGEDVAKKLLGEQTFADLGKVSDDILQNSTLKDLSNSGISLIVKLANSILSTEDEQWQHYQTE